MIRVDSSFLKYIPDFSYIFLVIFIVSGLFCYKRKVKAEYFLSNHLISIIVFQVCIMIARAKMEPGLAIGLFAMPGIIGYRTMPIAVREMTCLFLVSDLQLRMHLTLIQRNPASSFYQKYRSCS